jgi:hypothetical protein
LVVSQNQTDRYLFCSHGHRKKARSDNSAIKSLTLFQLANYFVKELIPKLILSSLLSVTGGVSMKYEKIIELVNNILQQYEMPLTLRQIFYRLVANFDYPNKNSAYCQLSKQLVHARKDGYVDENMIEDRSREFLGGDYGSDNVEEFLSKQVNDFLSSPKCYSRNRWNDQPEFVVVCVEKDALSRVVSNVADSFNVVTLVTRGYASYTYIKQAIERFPLRKDTIVLHFADHDPSGLDMTRDLEERFANYY